MPDQEAATHHRKAAENYEESASAHRLAAEARERGDDDEADRLCIEAVRLHQEGMRHEQAARRGH
jgi:hypothetical protein